ncbi:TRAP transporter small permease [Colwellia sp. 1_MG-2023]|uniref:TRAP transporter small permease n=1 Tax=Colwellia sp. 1_MG-2023 TaxID=3062649 RepID=UPI0026E1329B|nr:TRAP transporter small permease [Colwellia sp. 1_MG-2023]MDO6446961.1 TRAP transporter small permease [Colwellia sp. 1_MG-2023]
MIKTIDTLLSFTLAILMGLMVLDVTWQIFTRFATDSPSSWTEELARFLLIWIGLLGAAWAYRTRSHLGLSYLVEKQSPAMQKKLAIFSYLAAIVFAISVMIFGGSQLVLLTLNLNQFSASLGVKIGYVYMIIPISGVLITIYALDFIRATLAGELDAHLYQDIDKPPTHQANVTGE